MRIKPRFLFGAICAFPALASALSPRTIASTASQHSASSASNPTSPTSSFITSPALELTLTAEIREPQITDAPDDLLGDVSALLQEKYHQTTYWSCVTIATQVHCGWHEPILNGGDEIPGLASGREGVMGMVVGLVVAGVGVLMR